MGDLEVGVAKTQRIEMNKWVQMVNETGKKNNKEGYIPIPDEGDENISMKKDNPKASARPLVVVLDVQNMSPLPYKLESRQVFLSLKDGTLIKPSEVWQKKLEEAKIFGGVTVNALMPIQPIQMVLVYPVESETEDYKGANIRILYGSSDDADAIKIEFPITPSNKTNLGDYAQVMNRERPITQIALFSFYGMFALYLWYEWRKSKEQQTDDDYDDDPENE